MFRTGFEPNFWPQKWAGKMAGFRSLKCSRFHKPSFFNQHKQLLTMSNPDAPALNVDGSYNYFVNTVYDFTLEWAHLDQIVNIHPYRDLQKEEGAFLWITTPCPVMHVRRW